MAKPALGRGLGALLGGSPIAKPSPAVPTTTSAESAPLPSARPRVDTAPIERIRPCPFQPRKDFAPEHLQELADSIKEQGIVQPLVVREQGEWLELIAGERRWRAAQLAGLREVPIIRRQADDRAVLELALIENLQRENLNPMEEAQGYAQLIQQFQLTQEQAATRVGKSRAVVANSLRLLKLPQQVQSAVREGKLSVGHAKVILGLLSEREQSEAASRILKEGLNVRQAEALVGKMQAGTPKSSTPAAAIPKDSHVASMENRLRERMGTRINLRYAKGKGAIEISFFSDEELERILQIMGITPD